MKCASAEIGISRWKRIRFYRLCLNVSYQNELSLCGAFCNYIAVEYYKNSDNFIKIKWFYFKNQVIWKNQVIFINFEMRIWAGIHIWQFRFVFIHEALFTWVNHVMSRLESAMNNHGRTFLLTISSHHRLNLMLLLHLQSIRSTNFRSFILGFKFVEQFINVNFFKNRFMWHCLRNIVQACKH